jgi:hypothetical protein
MVAYPAGSRPSYPELAALVAAQAERVVQLKAEVAEAAAGAKLAEFVEAATVGFAVRQARAKVVALQERANPGGGKNGHLGATLAQVADPNETLRHEPGPYEAGDADLADAPEVGLERRQVFDLPR